jgi:hypothetical protein
MISASDYVSMSQHEIFPTDINDRITWLRSVEKDNGAAEELEMCDEEREELAALVDFRDRVQAETGNHFDEATIVPEDQFTEHARDWANSIADLDFLDSYVDWDEFAADLKGDRYTEMELGDSTVYVR